MIDGGVGLPKLQSAKKTAEFVGVDAGTIQRWLADRPVSVIRVNGVLSVLTESIADCLGKKTLSRVNQDAL